MGEGIFIYIFGEQVNERSPDSHLRSTDPASIDEVDAFPI